MVDIAEACIIIWDGESKGTKLTSNLALDKGIPTYIVNLKTNKASFFNR